jgi:hypothetical protein
MQGADVFVTKLSPSGNTLSYSTYLGGSADDFGYAIAVDSTGAAYVTGETSSTNFPTQNPFQATNAGSSDVFVTKLSPSGNMLSYSTYLGGLSYDYGYAIAVDSTGAAYVTGYTSSTDFPTQNPFQATECRVTTSSSPSSPLPVTRFRTLPTSGGQILTTAMPLQWTPQELPM